MEMEPRCSEMGCWESHSQNTVLGPAENAPFPSSRKRNYPATQPMLNLRNSSEGWRGLGKARREAWAQKKG